MAEEATWTSKLDEPASIEITPVWRVLDAKAPTLKKVTFDPAFMIDQRKRAAL